MNQILKTLNDDFFLYNTSDEIEIEVELGYIDEKALQDRWLGFPPATEADILIKEKQLGMALPPSYKRFLCESNGFRHISPFVYSLLSLEQVDWAKNIEEQWWLDICLEVSAESEVSDEMYFDYSDKQDSVHARYEYILESLKISEWGDAMCIYLNPLVKHGDEWEVLESASWFPGICRYRSFEEYLLKVHESNKRLNDDKKKQG